MRILVRALLPLGKGVMLDPFMGSGSTIAAGNVVGYTSIGIELDAAYFLLAQKAIPRLAALYPDFIGTELELQGNVSSFAPDDEKQLGLLLAEDGPSGHRTV